MTTKKVEYNIIILNEERKKVGKKPRNGTSTEMLTLHHGKLSVVLPGLPLRTCPLAM
jgi:hypothetical protein